MTSILTPTMDGSACITMHSPIKEVMEDVMDVDSVGMSLRMTMVGVAMGPADMQGIVEGKLGHRARRARPV